MKRIFSNTLKSFLYVLLAFSIIINCSNVSYAASAKNQANQMSQYINKNAASLWGSDGREYKFSVSRRKSDGHYVYTVTAKAPYTKKTFMAITIYDSRRYMRTIGNVESLSQRLYKTDKKTYKLKSPVVYVQLKAKNGALLYKAKNGKYFYHIEY